MKVQLVSVLALAAAGSLSAQARLPADLLQPSDRIAPPRITGADCDLRGFVDAGRYAELSPLQQQMVVRFANQVRDGHDVPSACWGSAQTDAAMALWNAVMQGPTQFNPVTRWSTTATDGGGLNDGDPTTLTYSFVPDGTTVPAANGAPAGPSTLFATFNAAFPSQATWQDRVHDALQRWGDLTGITYVYEPNDDGVQLSSASGQLGVRGDVRIACKSIDGGSNILAYNSYPNNGDMVLDQDDIGLFDNTSNNYRAFYNVIAHEHGHGIGIAHVCPINVTKLMEPFLGTAFEGPQFDDILTGQRLYGDANEPNDTPQTATDLGTLGNGTDFTTLQSIDGIADVDWFTFTVTTAKRVDIRVQPGGAPYLEGDQLGTGACEPGTNFDPRTLRNLGFELRDTNAAIVLQTTNAQPAGVAEVSAPFLLPAAGTYHLRVFGGAADTIQMYDLDVSIADAPAFELEVVGGPPATIPSDVPTAVTVRVLPGTGNVDPTSGFLFTIVNGTFPAITPVVPLGGDDYRALLPARDCYDTIRWYVAFQPSTGGALEYLPAGAPANLFETDVVNLPLTTVFADDFETAQAWSVQNDPALTDGAWNRGVPVGGGDRGDPATDADGSGQCYLTDNVDGNSDVDGAGTTLLSPLFNLSGYPEALLSYSYWYTNNTGSTPGQDVWVAEISADGGINWVTLQSTSSSTDEWTDVTFRVSDYVPLTPLVRVRFTASDPDPGAIVEAGLDAFRIEVCPPSPIEVLPGACGGPFASSTIGLDTSPIAGTTVNIQCSVAAQVAGPVFQGFVLGFAPVGAPLPSCGCIVHPTLDAIELGLGSWSAPALETWSLPLALPPGVTGAELYVQGLVAGSGANTCSEAGLFLNLTDGLKITVQ